GYLYPQSFMIVGQAGRLVYADALYLSMTVLTSTGFGDIARRSRGRRAASASSSRSPGRCSSRS
ncbi:MAG TPA: ion channel, partial [Casimicrobiaceae bacterium]|nr:ion channel [Casimicrobiaceae bacterium]